MLNRLNHLILVWSFCGVSVWGIGARNIGLETLKEVNAQGAVALDGTHVLSQAKVDGSFEARQDCIECRQESKSTARFVEKNTLVKGDIIFEKSGEVLLEKGAKIQGTVKNGKIITS